MKAILMSIKPEWVDKILDKEKTIEVRKRFPKDYKGWVYIYCTKNGLQSARLLCNMDDNRKFLALPIKLNGKVVARFWCDKVENIYGSNMTSFEKDSCVDRVPMFKYLNPLVVWDNKLENLLQASEGRKMGYAIHISKLEVFDKPKSLNEFMAPLPHEVYHTILKQDKDYHVFRNAYVLNRAPQSWQYIEE